MSPGNKRTYAVRVNGKLAEELACSRLSVEVTEPATIQDIIDEIKFRYPDSANTILAAIPFCAGNHKSPNEKISAGQEITLLMPAAGG
ncbi:MAG: hypothetical protein CL993_00425 [Euryarchaeota archaeon]|nr:hypothetical protein [Euryarchaeota archaeon]